MTVARFLLAAAVALAIAGCGGQPSPPAGEGAVAPAPTAAPASAAPSGDVAGALAAADPNKGRVLFLQCRACHSLVPESEPGKIGPTLYGVIGRSAGSVPGFAYSDALKQAGITWTPEQIDAWLARPSEFLPGNKMVFVGVQNPQDRANIIAYIQSESEKPAAQ